MKKILVMCKGVGQSAAFKKAAIEYVEKNNIDIEWYFSDYGQYVNVITENNIELVLISPEMIAVDAKVKSELDAKGVKYSSVKPSDFGLRRIDAVLKSIQQFM